MPALTCSMRCVDAGVLLTLSLGLLGSTGCHRGQPGDASASPPHAAAAAASEAEGAGVDPGNFGVPARWQIDGTTVAEDPSLPLELARALRDHGRRADEVQDHVIVDLNGDAELDAVLLLPAPAVAGAYDHLVLLSEGGSIRVHDLGELVDIPGFAVAVVPLVDGPTLVAVAPRIGSCERGPSWSFLRPTGAMLEGVGTIGVEPYDCAVADASLEFVRAAGGQVSAVELRHGEVLTRYVWDRSVGSFTPQP
ncbi:hypothetical protein DB30_00910 [Enhygromyxa salina]|uniref:Lipoprotein n=1 Tax=Enhygromyxa salina TaxID=215803 RepID=A0A0C1Z5K9_9BACT|nr:hypothetical protein [Enhygromyxa salina]KIG12889.1 hypothetical protein DB30_00910 [Enhygromyxa salina]